LEKQFLAFGLTGSDVIILASQHTEKYPQTKAAVRRNYPGFRHAHRRIGNVIEWRIIDIADEISSEFLSKKYTVKSIAFSGNCASDCFFSLYNFGTKYAVTSVTLGSEV
jgi:hypothetical protein